MNKRVIVITSIDNVQPYRYRPGVADGGECEAVVGEFVVVDGETDDGYTGIECTINNEHGESEDIILMLPRGDEPCVGTYLLADAIRED